MKKIVVPLYTTEFEKTLMFYSKLGFDVVNKNTLFLEKTCFQINLYDTPVVIKNDKKGIDLFFISIQVENIEYYKEQLIARGVKVEEIQNPPTGEYVYLRDPNENRICVYESYE